MGDSMFDVMKDQALAQEGAWLEELEATEMLQDFAKWYGDNIVTSEGADMAYYDKGWELVRMTPHYRLRHPEFGYTDTMSCSPKNPSGAYKSAMKKLNTYNYEGDAR